MNDDVLRALPLMIGALVLGGLVVALTGRAEFRQRWQSWLFVAPIVLLAGASRFAAIVLVSVLGVIAATEYGRLVGLRLRDRAVIAVACPC
jgi:predicted CDP-diglyceride synthetase/phosphatidate cytidylyltransferase